MNRIRRVLVGMICLAALSGPFASGADRGPAPPEADFVDSWFLVRLAEPLQDRFADGSFPLVTGFRALDELIVAVEIQRIEHALPVSNRAPRNPEALRRYGLDRVYKLFVPEGADIPALVERFAALPEVDYAEPDYIMELGALVPNDPLFPDQWGYDQESDADVDGPEGWEVNVGEGVIIAMCDTGVDSDHEEFVGKLVPGTDIVNDDDDPEDDHGHGTRTTSIASAQSDNGVGMAGACWNCRIMPVKVFNASGGGNHSWSADGFIWATDNGARVINQSGGSTTGSETLHNGVKYAYDAGVVMTHGTANDGCNCVRFPAAYPETIAIGGTDMLDRRAAPFSCNPFSGSNFGNEIDVCAPADLITVAERGGGYSGNRCGNSFAGPRGGGLAGIIETIYPSAGRDEVRHLMHSGGDDQVGRSNEDVAGFDIYHGWGRLNFERTLLATEASITLRVEGKSSTRVFYETANPVADSYDFMRGDVGALSESAAGVDLGTVICLEDDSPDPDTAGDEDTGIISPGEVFFYVGRFNAAPGPGSFGGSSQNRDRAPSSGGCPG